MKDSDKSEPLETLLAMPLNQRIEAVANDVQSRADVFRLIDAFDLAEALEVPQPELPSNEWVFTSYADPKTVEEFIDEGGEASEVLEWLEDTVEGQRLDALRLAFAKQEDAASPSFDFLTATERAFVEDIIMERQLEANQSNGMNCMASYCVTHGDLSLSFEADVEDDGSCITLRTPYDERDGQFLDLSDGVTDSW